jgi:hypothetical protein
MAIDAGCGIMRKERLQRKWENACVMVIGSERMQRVGKRWMQRRRE